MNQSRRKFIKTTTTASAAALFTSIDNKPIFTMNDQFKIKIFATNWGYEGTIDSFCEKAKAAGYDGIENGWPTDEKGQDEMFAALKKHQLEVGFLCGIWNNELDTHLPLFKKIVEDAARQTRQRPAYINCHSGKDFFSQSLNEQFIAHTIAISKETGIRILHETHRGRMLFAAHITRSFIEKIKGLRITLDISHWCNVHESLLEDQQETVAMALDRTDHIHARIGYSEGPQVNDPRAPEWASTVQQHFDWWDKVVERKREAGETLTFLTEFGPPLYTQTLPYTCQPVSDQWAINVHILKLLRERYS